MAANKRFHPHATNSTDTHNNNYDQYSNQNSHFYSNQKKSEDIPISMKPREILPWRRILYEKQSYRDNHYDPSNFFTQLTIVQHQHLSHYSFLQAMFHASLLTQQFSAVTFFFLIYQFLVSHHLSLAALCLLDLVALGTGCIVYFGFLLSFSSRLIWKQHLLEFIRVSILFYVCLRIASPVIMTLTLSVSEDTICAVAVLLCSVHLLSHDYTSNHYSTSHSSTITNTTKTNNIHSMNHNTSHNQSSSNYPNDAIANSNVHNKTMVGNGSAIELSVSRTVVGSSTSANMNDYLIHNVNTDNTDNNSMITSTDENNHLENMHSNNTTTTNNNNNNNSMSSTNTATSTNNSKNSTGNETSNKNNTNHTNSSNTSNRAAMVSLSTALFTAMMFASRFTDTNMVVAFIVFAVITFTLFPIVCRSLNQQYPVLQVMLALLQWLVTSRLIWWLETHNKNNTSTTTNDNSPDVILSIMANVPSSHDSGSGSGSGSGGDSDRHTLFVVYQLLIVLLWVVGPLLFLYMQRAKQILCGPWDIPQIPD